ncbi:phage head closure protein [Shinella sp.]|uniref:phage head closure protein n=1 Tax=Shinella sp. TaxID=1870904 RepID=UPI0028AD01DE|nr:phage head closure protein [Shinella sp.]
MATKPRRQGSGSLSERIAFLQEVEGDDGSGGVTLGWQSVFEEAGRLAPIFGSRLTVESVTAARLQANQPYNLTVRSNDRTRGITAAWRVRNVRTGKEYNIKTVVNPDERNAYLEMLVVEGEAG